MAHYQKALQVKPDYAAAHNNWGIALGKMGRFDDATASFQEAVRINPDYAEAHYNWGIALRKMGRFEEAIAHYQMALRIKPDFADAHNNLAWLLATCPEVSIRDGQQALEHAQRVVELVGDNDASVLDSLAAAYAQLGDFQQAVLWQQKAVEMAGKKIKDDLAARLELYKQGQPFREKSQGGPYRESH